MKDLNKDYVVEQFKKYTADYNAEDPKIKLKIDHTFRVAEFAEEISQEVPGTDTELAWLCGMLHDIGRFEQVRRFNTFSDALSVDHAMLGADLLFIDGLLDSFGSYTDYEKKVLEVSIRNHSAYRIEEGLTEDLMNYCRILRDADKVDIFRVNYDTPLEDIYNVTTEDLKNSLVSDAVKNSFREKHAVLRKLKETAIDNLVGHFCLVFELEFEKSRELAKRLGYVDKLLEYESDNEDTRKWFEFMRENIWK